MTKRTVWVVIGTAFLCAALVGAQTLEKKSPPEPSPEEMEAMMAEMSAPNEHHKHLAMLVGDWTYSAKMWMPGAPDPVNMTGTASTKPVLGGLFFETTWHGDFMGQPFEGIAVEGYDKAQKQYTTTWRDNFGTYTMFYTGECDGTGKVRTSTGKITDPMSGETLTEHGKTTFNEDGTILMESWRVMSGGEKHKSMEIVLKRS